MKRNFFLLMLLFLATTVLFALQVEFRTISEASEIKMPKGFKWTYFSNIQIVDTVDNYLICLKKHPGYSTSEVFLLDKETLSVKTLELPKEYAKLTPTYLCKLKGNHFVKLYKGEKHNALALFDEHMNFVKAMPMNKFGLICQDDNYIYIHNTPVTYKTPEAYEGELVKLDRDMNVIVRKPLTVSWDKTTYRGEHSAVDTLGHIIFNNRGTYMLVDRETLDQTKLDVIPSLDFEERAFGTLIEYDQYLPDKIIHLMYKGYYLAIREVDYEGNVLLNKSMKFDQNKKSIFLDYKNDKVYILVAEEKNLSVQEIDMTSETVKIVSSFQLEENIGAVKNPFIFGKPSYPFKTYLFAASVWKYVNNCYNLITTTTESEYYEDGTSLHDKYTSYLHLDENFNLLKMEEDKNYNRLRAANQLSYLPQENLDDYSIIIYNKPIIEKKNKNAVFSEVNFIIWDKTGGRKEIPSGVRFFSGTEKVNDMPAFYKISPTRYYIFSRSEAFKLTEAIVKP